MFSDDYIPDIVLLETYPRVECINHSHDSRIIVQKRKVSHIGVLENKKKDTARTTSN